MHDIVQPPRLMILESLADENVLFTFADVLTPARANLKTQNAINTVFVATHADLIRKRVLKRMNADAGSERNGARQQIVEDGEVSDLDVLMSDEMHA